jgi:hypothetical protein
MRASEKGVRLHFQGNAVKTERGSEHIFNEQCTLTPFRSPSRSVFVPILAVGRLV